MNNATTRFSSRVDNYVKYRPSYPQAMIEHLAAACRLASGALIADVGSGTGLLAELLLKRGFRVLGVEPNAEMRGAGERLLQEYSHFTSVAGTAEATTLADHSVDAVTAGQAFHWFDRDGFRAECARILKPGGYVALIWNDRRTGSTPFLQAYERLLLAYGTDYTRVNHKQIEDHALAAFFGAAGFQKARFENQQVFDFAGLQGRLLSSSYVPEANHSSYQPMLAELRAIFDTYQRNGQVVFEYDTAVYYGQISASALR
jgi:ubiquinone/menaquinone biosynthesis C-methylase UbiE